MKIKHIFFVLQISLFSGIFVDALRCYDPAVANDTIKICEEAYEPGEYVCYKVVSVSQAGYDLVSVGCYPEEDVDAFCAGVIKHGAVACMSCRVDLCNSSNKTESINVMFVALILFSIALS